VDRAHKVFARSAIPSRLRFANTAGAKPAAGQVFGRRSADAPPRSGDLAQHVDRMLLARYAPPGVLVNEKMEILQFRGLTGAYLQPAPGTPQNNLIKMARGGLLAALRTTIAKAKQQMAPARAEAVEIDDNGSTQTCNLLVLPFTGLPDTGDLTYVVLFEPGSPAVAAKPRRSSRTPPSKESSRVAKLEHELAATKDYLHSLVDEQGGPTTISARPMKS
jgi:two-component system CheB/CheR fusion protein